MRRIELLLCNVIPGASEFIAHGTHTSLAPQQQQQQPVGEQKGLSLNLHGLKQQSRQKRDVILSPQELLSRISLASPGTGPSTPFWARNTSGQPALQEDDVPSSEASNYGQEQQHNLPSSQQAGSPSSTPDYVQRMERIEILLRTVQNLPLAQGIFSDTRQQHPDASEDLSASRKKQQQQQQQKTSKKHGKTEARKQKSGNMINSNGAVVKRPHVAAGFAGQKPPPKLPQAIAEAAKKRQATRKKRVTAAAARAAATANTTTATTTVDASTMDNAAGLSSPSLSREQQQHQHQHQQHQHQHQIEMLGHSHRQVGAPAFNMYQQHQRSQHRLPAATINSMAIPMTSSYGSLVVPASSSTCSSATSSPRTERAEALSVEGTEQGDMGMSPRSEDSSVRAASVDQMLFSESQFPFQQQGVGHSVHSMPYSQVQAPPAIGMGMDFSFVGQTGAHPFSDQYVSRPHQPLQTSQATAFPDFGLGMGESLESLMKKNMGSLDGLLSDLSGGAALSSSDATTITSPSLSMPMQSLLQGTSTPAFEHGVYAPSATAAQFNYLQQQQRDLQQRQAPPAHAAHQDTLKSIWIPSHSGSFAVPANTEYAWQQQQQQQQQQHQSTLSINISANDSPQSEAGPELDLDGDQQQQQQPLSAHDLFQQQHEQQQQQQQQEEQLRKNSLVLDTLQPQQHRASIQHQHLQSFYIPQMQDEDDDGGF
ncbi:hypothetical protein BGZ70_001514 [Mortierella alpina]|uniref:Uncharacterized protein n=1 Tax=Mortierella alpina TaxID=64518 RepID=A0A9P6IVX8_MORAP|nr:hypothetical protein BGZ70_001514 [Mortierella alpina]